jgi:NAD(P)-dependent dehydrogenase (short-subunit alcohol dehydrogenase family)
MFHRYFLLNYVYLSAATISFGNVEQVSAGDWSHFYSINVRGYALTAKYIAPILKKQKSGSIINVSSTLGLVAIPNTVVYSSCKGAIIQLTRNLAHDLGPFNIRVNSVSPGRIESPVGDEQAKMLGLAEILNNFSKEASCLKRVGQAKEIANTIVFLISDLCPFMTGANLIIDGGMTII